jgi:hypothetical protein
MNILAALVKGEKVDLNYRLGYSNEKKHRTNKRKSDKHER